MRRAPAALAAIALAALAACTEDPGTEAGAEPTWSVACSAGSTPVEGLGELELDCLGDEASTSVGTGGKPLVLVLWASWCIPCQDEAPEVQAFFEAHGDQVDVLGVDTADTRERGRWFAEEFAMTYPSAFDPDEAVRTGLGVPGLPGVAFVAPDGTVAELVVEPGVTAESLAATAEAAFGLELG
ncbi:TlpA family protein disulfide reductase [Glycomyces paridis]|uniref:TlpA family protein disulfide reductase n=1 Tax=Glycomyces paridis TaxID=2126555 RepID=UPI00130542FF|nr:TlpA disulfide reductase family protein [Glycomyces paridis]